MSGGLTAQSIALPWWHAVVSREALGHPPGPVSMGRSGGLAVFEADRGAEVAPLRGRPGSVVFDGFLFDRVSLARELQLIADATDGVVAAAAYEAWGADLFTRLDGCYLIAILDAHAGRLLLGHDALGRHPAFYSLEGGEVRFASNLLALVRSGALSRRPNRLSLALDVLLYWPEAGETHIESVKRVRSGHYLEVTAEAAHERKYFDPLPAEDEPMLDADVVRESFESSIERAVGKCLDLGAQGIMLSGGVDSVTIAALAGRLTAARQAPLVAVSARTGGPPIAEEAMQTLVADALRMPHVISTTRQWIAGRDPIQLSLDLMAQLPSPTRIWWVGTYTEFYRRTAARHLNVLLTGAGGDNWLGVADAYAADLMRGLHLGELWRFVRSDMGTGGASFESSARRLLWASGLRLHVDTAWARLAPARKANYHRRKWVERLPSWLAPDPALREELVERLLARRTPSVGPDHRPPRSYYAHSLRTLANPYMHFENETAFHVETMCGLRLLSPYHDRDLVTFFNRIPPRLLLHGARYKGLLRPVVARHLPDLGLENQRKDYPADAQNRKLTELRQSVTVAWDGFALDTLDGLGVVDSARARRQLVDFSRKPFEDLAQTFVLMSSERWLRANALG